MAISGTVLRPNFKEFDIVKTYYTSAPHEPTKQGLLHVDFVQPYTAEVRA